MKIPTVGDVVYLKRSGVCYPGFFMVIKIDEASTFFDHSPWHSNGTLCSMFNEFWTEQPHNWIMVSQ